MPCTEPAGERTSRLLRRPACNNDADALSGRCCYISAHAPDIVCTLLGSHADHPSATPSATPNAAPSATPSATPSTAPRTCARQANVGASLCREAQQSCGPVRYGCLFHSTGAAVPNYRLMPAGIASSLVQSSWQLLPSTWQVSLRALSRSVACLTRTPTPEPWSTRPPAELFLAEDGRDVREGRCR